MNEVFIHPHAIVEAVAIGRGTRVWAFSHLMKEAVIGSDCNIGEHCFVESGAVIRNRVTVKNGCQIWEGVTLEDDVFVGPQVLFTNDLYPRSPRMQSVARKYRERNKWLIPTLVRRGASIGAGAVILAGNTLNPFCLVAAGSVVTREVPAYAITAGNPARITGWICPCGKRLSFLQSITQCTCCGLGFAHQDGHVIELSPVCF